MMDNYEFLQRKREEFANEPIIPPPLVRGDDLLALGLKPGPKIRGDSGGGGDAATGRSACAIGMKRWSG